MTWKAIYLKYMIQSMDSINHKILQKGLCFLLNHINRIITDLISYHKTEKGAVPLGPAPFHTCLC